MLVSIKKGFLNRNSAAAPKRSGCAAAPFSPLPVFHIGLGDWKGDRRIALTFDFANVCKLAKREQGCVYAPKKPYIYT